MILADFLKTSDITIEEWEKSNFKWEELEEVAIDHQKNTEELRDTAEFFARIIQKIAKVHSVRWRVKDPYHLIEKIIRKRLEGSQKYADIGLHNYKNIITDLVGLRALHLFKDECFSIGDDLQKKWKPIEPPIAYIRSGDQENLSKQLESYGLEVKSHPAGYRSIHYVFSSQAVQNPISVEVQVRTIFEEGWSEIDHKIRYPNFTNDPLVTYFLTIFNRLSGSADEMGGFVKGLTSTLSEMKEKVKKADLEKDRYLQEMEKALADLSELRTQDAKSQELIGRLRVDITQLRKAHEAVTSIEPPSELAPSTTRSGTHPAPAPPKEIEEYKNSEWYKFIMLLEKISKYQK